jgi:hypothetical protein
LKKVTIAAILGLDSKQADADRLEAGENGEAEYVAAW